MPDYFKEFERENERVQRYPVKELKRSLIIPSPIHNYSMAIEFMIRWFQSQMPTGFFKTVHVSGKHVLDDVARFDEGIFAKRIKPALTIIPNINLEYDRQNIDLYNYGANILFRANREFGESFFKDYANNLYIGVRNHELEMPFTFRVRVNTKSEQQRMYEEIRLHCRVGGSTTNYINADFIVPMELMKAVAYDAGFAFDDEGNIKSPIDFCIYLNTMSAVPFVYKRRNMTGNFEYFVRVNGIHTHILSMDQLSTDDGEQVGQITDNYMVEYQCILHITVPHMYYYFGKNDNGLQVNVTEHADIGVYRIRPQSLSDVDPNGFKWVLDDDYQIEDEDIQKGYIDITDWIENTVKKDDTLSGVFSYCDEVKISYGRFMNIRVAKGGDYLNISMDYETMKINLPADIDLGLATIIIYMDLLYINDVMIEKENAKKTRLGE